MPATRRASALRAPPRRPTAAWVHDADLTVPLLLLVGGERRGITRSFLDDADLLLRIPYGRRGAHALGAATSAALLAFEVLRQRRAAGHQPARGERRERLADDLRSAQGLAGRARPMGKALADGKPKEQVRGAQHDQQAVAGHEAAELAGEAAADHRHDAGRQADRSEDAEGTGAFHVRRLSAPVRAFHAPMVPPAGRYRVEPSRLSRPF